MESLWTASALIFILAVLIVVGVIFHRKKNVRHCGSIEELGLEKICDCEEPCNCQQNNKQGSKEG